MKKRNGESLSQYCERVERRQNLSLLIAVLTAVGAFVLLLGEH